MLELFPDSADVEDGELTLGGVGASTLAERFGTPLVVYCAATIRGAARAYRRGRARRRSSCTGRRRSPTWRCSGCSPRRGSGADVSTLGELAFAPRRRAIDGSRLVVHGNNKSDEELSAAAGAGAGLVVLDSADEIERAAAAGVRRVLVRVTPGIEADTHEAIRTAHRGSKFGLPPDAAVAAIARAREAGLDVAGLHTHIGSQLVDLGAAGATVDWLGAFAARCRAELDWTPAVVDLGGGLGVRHVVEEEPPSIADFAGTLLARLAAAWSLHGLPAPRVVLEPGRSLVGRAGVTLYRVGTVKRAGDATAWVAVDGGVSDNPRPELYGARYTALVAGRADAEPDGWYAVAGKHCESGDVLIGRVELAAPRGGDVLAVPATGAYTLGMASNYNAVPRPAAVLVKDGEARVIRRRETIDDLLALETGSIRTPTECLVGVSRDPSQFRRPRQGRSTSLPDRRRPRFGPPCGSSGALSGHRPPRPTGSPTGLTRRQEAWPGREPRGDVGTPAHVPPRARAVGANNSDIPRAKPALERRGKARSRRTACDEAHLTAPQREESPLAPPRSSVLD